MQSPRALALLFREVWGSFGGGLWGFDFAAILLTDGCFILPLVPEKTEGVLERRSHDQIVFVNQ